MSEWEAHLCPRGGGTPLAVLPFTSLRSTRRLDDLGSASVAGPHTDDGWAGVAMARKWEHELVLYRGTSLEFAGPLTGIGAQPGRGWSLEARDLFQWFERRWPTSDRTFVEADLARVFERVAVDALVSDPSPNITVLAHDCGILGDRQVVVALRERVADLLRELARTGVDWTFVGREMRVGGQEVPAVALATLIDEQVVWSSSSADWGGLADANDVVVRGTAPHNDDGSPGVVPYGRAQRPPSQALLGLLQRRYDEPQILDVPSANAAAATRADLLAVDLPTMTLVVTPDVADTYPELVPGARIDTAFSAALFGREVVGTFRLLDVSVQVGDSGEQVSLTLQPPGTPG